MSLRILILQTTRMGDVLQTTPLIRQVRQQHPHAHISVMVRGMGKAIVEHCPDVDAVLVHEEDTLFQHLRAQDSDRLLQAYAVAEEHVQRIAEGHFDVVYNVTHSIGSAMLLKIAGVREVVGAHLSDDWQFVLRGAWTTYFFTSVFNRDYNDLNLCDITRNFAPVGPPCKSLVFDLRDEDRAWATTLLEQHGVGDSDFVACLQLGASENNKRWTELRFAELARLLVERKAARVFLVGVKEEAALGGLFERHAPGLAIPLYGKSSVPQLAALLARSSILVTNDTGTMHIAAAVQCPIALVSVGHVHYRETGPYGEGHCAVEARRQSLGRSDFVPGGLEERDAITAEQVYIAVELALAARHGEAPAQRSVDAAIANVDFYTTRFAPDGCLQFYPAVRRPMGERDLLRMAYRAMWIEHLNARRDPEAESETLAAMLSHFAVDDTTFVQAWAEAHAVAFAELAEIALRGEAITRGLVAALASGGSMVAARRQVDELTAIDEEARIFAEVNPACRALTLIARYERDNLEGSDPRALASTTLQIYGACRTRAALVAEKLARIVSLLPRQP